MLEFFILKRKRLQGDLAVTFQCVKGSYERGEEGLFTRMCSYRTRSSGFKLKVSRFRL